MIETGDLSAHRDITDVRDMVAAFPLLLEQGMTGEAYNAGRGETYRMQDLLDRLVAQSRVRSRSGSRRAGAQGGHGGDPGGHAKLRQATGWEPAHPPRPDPRRHPRRLAKSVIAHPYYFDNPAGSEDRS